MKPVTQPEMLLFVPPKVHALRLPFLFLSPCSSSLHGFPPIPSPFFPLLAASIPCFHARLLFLAGTLAWSPDKEQG